MSTLPHEYSSFYIDGGWRPSGSSDVIDVVSPATGERIGGVPAATASDIDAAVAAARRAFDETDWAHRPVHERAELCRRLATAISERQPDLAELFTEEMGCTHFLSDVYQATAPTLHWNYYAAVGEQYEFAEVRESDLLPLAGSGGGGIVPFAGKSLVVKEPVGVAAVMCAYNFALACVAQKAGPALVAGCTVVVKVPEQNPLAIFAMGDMITEAGFPPGVFNIVAARAESSERLVRHPGVDMVSFTGSTAVGRRIGEICGSLIRPCVLELGGKSAAIVLPDADLEQALPALIGASVGTNAGQSCVCLSRFLVPRDRQDEITAKLVEGFESLKVGDPMEPDTVVSPLISEAHRERVLGYIRKGVEEGATLATGGKVPDHLQSGWFVEPTLLTNVDNEMTVAQEEIFGPVVVMIPYEDEEDAIRIANDSDYGLSGAVFTSDPAHGFEVARRIRAGTYSVNTFAADFNSPFGGYKRSGIGREHGVAGFEGYLLTKTISVDPSSELPPEVVADVAAAPAVV
jgi:betaine-aldehyde dehydrogenase